MGVPERHVEAPEREPGERRDETCEENEPRGASAAPSPLDGLEYAKRHRWEGSALAGSAFCYALQNQTEKLTQRLQEIRLILQGMDKETRHRWEEWLKPAGYRP